MRSIDDVRTEVAALLGGLGDTRGQVAQSLEDRGIQGVRESAHSCPIAKLIRQDFPELTVVDVSEDKILIDDGGNTAVAVDVPRPVDDFIERFDCGDFPELVLGGDL